MKYRDARLLKPGDQVLSKKDNEPLVVITIEVYGSIKIVKVNIVDQFNNYYSLFNDHIV